MLSSEKVGTQWFSLQQGEHPILLIAPHAACRQSLVARGRVPKVNDLHTGWFTRELARRTRASAIINDRLDRNILDANRLSQLAALAPGFLTAIEHELRRLLSLHERAVVLIIHGWNVVQPRVDFGIGGRFDGASFRRTAGGVPSVNWGFIDTFLQDLAERFRSCGIRTSFGLRYPGATRENLLQGLTARHLRSRTPELSRLSAIALSGLVEAVQIELSVALRWPGPLRETALEGLSDELMKWVTRSHCLDQQLSWSPKARTDGNGQVRISSGVTPEFGLELYDPVNRVGISLSLFAKGAGRLIVLTGTGAAGFYTAEGNVTVGRGSIWPGELTVRFEPAGFEACFDGHLMLADDGAAFIDTEAGLAAGRICRATLRISGDLGDKGYRDFLKDEASHAPASRFATVSGALCLENCLTQIRAGAKIGPPSHPAIRANAGESALRLWVCFMNGQGLSGLETGKPIVADENCELPVRIFSHGASVTGRLSQLQVRFPALRAMPGELKAELDFPGRERVATLTGSMAEFLTLTRPGRDRAPVRTTLGFGTFALDGWFGVGKVEVSQLAAEVAEEGNTTPE